MNPPRLQNKKIWIDLEEPKAPIMFAHMIRWFQEEGAELLITARDFDSTFNILDDMDLDYLKVGAHGGDTIVQKMKTYIERLDGLFEVVVPFQPDFFVTFGSVEGPRLSMGLQIPSIGFSDEPRSYFVSKQLFPFIDQLITPECIPIEDYLAIHADRKKIIRFNGIDEIAWLSHYTPNPALMEEFGIQRGKFVLMRSEPASADYFLHKLKPEETLISQIFPPLYAQHPDYTYFLLVRNDKQEKWLRDQLKEYGSFPNVRITQYLPHIVDLCFYAAVVISGGGTIVRESSLLHVPSIEFFPGDSAPQEIFLTSNGFPMEHIRDPKIIVKRALDIMAAGPGQDRFNLSFRTHIAQFEDPCRICFDYVVDKLGKLTKT